MKVTSMRVGRTVSDGGYGNRRIDLDITLDDGEQPGEAYRRGLIFCNEMLSRGIDVEQKMTVLKFAHQKQSKAIELAEEAEKLQEDAEDAMDETPF